MVEDPISKRERPLFGGYEAFEAAVVCFFEKAICASFDGRKERSSEAEEEQKMTHHVQLVKKHTVTF